MFKVSVVRADLFKFVIEGAVKGVLLHEIEIAEGRVNGIQGQLLSPPLQEILSFASFLREHPLVFRYNIFEMSEEVSSSLLGQVSSLVNNQTEEVLDFLVRKSDNDDYAVLNKMITDDIREIHDALFDYPNILKLIETSFISVTVLDRNQRVIGCATFNDFPQGIRGKHDFRHQNFWQEWLPKACDLLDKNISPRNSLWLTFFFVNGQFKRDEKTILERVLQNIYNYQSHLDCILFLKRGQAVRSQMVSNQIATILKEFFIQLQVVNRQALKVLVGISHDSEFYYCHKSMVVEIMEIRMAKEEDHDDLADIFNKQSGVLTSQYGEFFIADLIATQNLTRRLTKGSDADGKAIVGQVRDKAVGLMSISKEIDYKLLSNCFQLQLYDNLLKQEYMQAYREREEELREQRVREEQRKREQELKNLRVEQHKCRIIGQRLCLQQYCIEKQLDIKVEIDFLKTNQQSMKQLNYEKVSQMIGRWMNNFALNIPGPEFTKFPDFDTSLETYILTPSDFFLQTLQIFGLPKNYMYGEGHWKDWAKKILEERKSISLRRPAKKKKAPARGGKKKQQKKDDQQLKPPAWFDIAPFDQAFNKFISVNPELRTTFRQEVSRFYKKVVMFFCDKDGCMIDEYTVDLLSLGKQFASEQMIVPQPINQNMAYMLQAFGGIKYKQNVIQVQVKEEQTRKFNASQKKETAEPVKMVDVQQKLTNWKQFYSAIKTIEEYDQILCSHGRVRSQALSKQLQEIQQQQSQHNSSQVVVKRRSSNSFSGDVKNMKLGELPEWIPQGAHNAFVIILFCIDQIYENRSMDFLPYAFQLFPDRNYVILTQPFNVPQNSLLQNFIQVPHKKNSTFQHTLYIFHRDSLMANLIRVRRAEVKDLTVGSHLLEGLKLSEMIGKDMKQSIVNVSSKKVTFSVNCQDQIIGLFTMSKLVNLDYYISHFNIKNHLIISQHPREKHSRIVHAVLNPLFSKSTRFILRQIMRLMNKTNLYFQVHERTLLPSIFDQLIFLKAMNFPKLLKRKWDYQIDPQEQHRRITTKNVLDGERNPFDQEDAPFSLSFISKRYLSSNKVSNNTRIVVVGASDTGISFIESLLMIKDVNFTSITLLAPGGLLTMHVNSERDLLKGMTSNYSLEQLRSLMIDARVTVLDAKMIKLDKKEKRIHLDKNAVLPFDILVIAVGLIDTQLQTLGLVSAGLNKSPHYKEKKYIQGVYSIDDPYLYSQFSLNKGKGSNLYLLTRTRKPECITVYGRTPNTIIFISGLINRGVHPSRIKLVIPQATREHKKQFANNQQRLEYEDSLINDPDLMEDPNMQKLVVQELRARGVQIFQGFNYYRIQTEDNFCKQVYFRKKADNYDQLQKKIKQKRIEIQIRAEELGNNKGFDNTDEEDLDNQQENSPEKQIQQLQQQQWNQLCTKSRFLVTSGLVDIDLQIFHIIHQNGLVYNGRLIVKSNFQTTQNQVFACGKICQFSQRYRNKSVGRSLRLDKYNGRQLGVKLSKHILEMIDLSHLTTQNYTVDDLPKLYFPVGLGGCLPNNMVFYHIKKIDWAQHKSVYLREREQGFQRKEIMMNNIEGFKGHYMRFSIDYNDIIQSVSYMGSEDIQVSSLLIFVGLSVKYLNKLSSRFENGLIPNIAQFLSENWAMALYHNYFDGLRVYLKEEILMGQACERILIRAEEHAKEGNFLSKHFFDEAKSMIPTDVYQSIREGIMDFISRNQNHLPMYYIPPKQTHMHEIS